ncbi:lactose/L-arabinose transport system substrate-binding protein [Lachnospiraceae bacterium C7]|nr:lactose/L-arabinose transport system substrate-binding protein [Lachnospiraceae bacterium C7]
MMKKKVVSVLLASAMVASLAACGTGEGSASKGSSEKKAKKVDVTKEDKNTLSVYAWDKNFNIPALKAAEKAYQKKNPKFKLNIIEQSQSSDVETAITTAGSAGDFSTLPDIVLFQDHYIQKYVTDYPKAWINVDDADIDWKDFGEEKVSYSTIKGKHYGVPVDNGTVVFAYRVDLLEKCGYTLDDVTGITWDKFIEIGEKVHKETGKYLLSMDGDGNDLPYMMLQAEGASQFKDGKAYITDNKKLVEVINKIVEMKKKDVLYLANDWSDYTDQTIIGDKVAGVMNGNWIIPTIEQVKENEGKWEITSMPTLSGEEGYASNGGSSLYITSNCRKADLAKDFLAYTFGGGEGSQDTYDNALKDGGVITTCISAGKSEVYNEGVKYFKDQAIYSKIVEMGSHVKVVEQSDFHYTCREQIAAAIQNILNGTDTKTALKDAEKQLKFSMEK